MAAFGCCMRLLVRAPFIVVGAVAPPLTGVEVALTCNEGHDEPL